MDSIKEIYHHEFDEALKEYNIRQTRADRIIDDYLDHLDHKSSDVAVEVIIQLGDRDFWELNKVDSSKMNLVFNEQVKSLERHCPEFKIASAVVHYEPSPHMHVVGVPVVEQCNSRNHLF